MSNLSEVEAAVNAGLMRDALTPVPITPGEVYERIIPAGWTKIVTDTEALLLNPNRPSGTIVARTAPGFITAVLHRTSDEQPVVMYADEQNAVLVAILNDDEGANAGWRDYRVELGLKMTPEWMHWKEHQGQRNQTAFAEAIEQGLDEIKNPTPADMLRIAETFEANINVNFAQGEQLRDGARQLVFQEDVKAKAGGSLEIPEAMTLAVAPFLGGPKYQIVAKIRFRIREQKLTIGYDLVRPHEVEAAAFVDTVAEIRAAVGDFPLIEGLAPSPRVASRG